MTTRTWKALLLMIVLAVTALAAPRPAQATVRVDIGFFYDALAPYGSWFEHPRYGWVWAPDAISVSWRPYWDGHWAYANGYGWTWASSDPWGWATDHYGRWVYDDFDGWIWVPGYEWAPAWVDFVSYDGWIGWAPLPPAATWSVNVGFTPRYSVGYDQYVFVEPRYLTSTSWQRYAAPRDRAARWARAGRRITRYQVAGDRIVNRSLTYVPRAAVEIVDVASPRSVRRAVDRGRLTVFRPQVARSQRLAPPRRAVVSRADRARGRGHGAALVPRDTRRLGPARGHAAAPSRPAVVQRAPRTIERVAPAPRRPAVTRSPQRARQPAVTRAPRHSARQATPPPRRPVVRSRVEQRPPAVTHRGPQRATRQVAPAPSRRSAAQVDRGHGRRQSASPPRNGRQKDKRHGGG